MSDRTDLTDRSDPVVPPFAWAVYRDATLAGLSVLIPLPLVDLAFETLFRRRIPFAVTRHRGRDLDPRLLAALGSEPPGCLGCLLFPLWLALEFLKRLFRTVLYFLTVKAATDRLAVHWRRAFLIDHMTRRGDLDGGPDAPRVAAALAALQAGLRESDTGPLLAVAREVLTHARHVLRTAWRTARRRRAEDDETRDARRRLELGWSDLRASFAALAAAYDRRMAAAGFPGGVAPAGAHAQNRDDEVEIEDRDEDRDGDEEARP